RIASSIDDRCGSPNTLHGVLVLQFPWPPVVPYPRPKVVLVDDHCGLVVVHSAPDARDRWDHVVRSFPVVARQRTSVGVNPVRAAAFRRGAPPQPAWTRYRRQVSGCHLSEGRFIHRLISGESGDYPDDCRRFVGVTTARKVIPDLAPSPSGIASLGEHPE